MNKFLKNTLIAATILAVVATTGMIVFQATENNKANATEVSESAGATEQYLAYPSPESHRVTSEHRVVQELQDRPDFGENFSNVRYVAPERPTVPVQPNTPVNQNNSNNQQNTTPPSNEPQIAYSFASAGVADQATIDRCVGFGDITQWYGGIPAFGAHWHCGGSAIANLPVGSIVEVQNGPYAGLWKFHGLAYRLNGDIHNISHIQNLGGLQIQTCLNGNYSDLGFFHLTRL